MNDELIVHRVAGTVADATANLREALERRGITIFATIDHAAGARAAGLRLPEEVVVIFGDPAVGTGLMVDDPRTGVDLPVRMLLWDDAGTTKAGYRDPAAYFESFDLDAHSEVPGKLSALMVQLVTELGATVAP